MYVNLPKQDSTSPPNCDLTSCWFARVTMLHTSFWFAFSSFSYWICKKGTCLEIREQCKCSLPRQCTYKLEVEWANSAKINWQANFATVMLKKTFLTVLRFRLAELHMERHGWIWISSQSQNAQLSLSVSLASGWSSPGPLSYLFSDHSSKSCHTKSTECATRMKGCKFKTYLYTCICMRTCAGKDF